VVTTDSDHDGPIFPNLGGLALGAEPTHFARRRGPRAGVVHQLSACRGAPLSGSDRGCNGGLRGLIVDGDADVWQPSKYWQEWGFPFLDVSTETQFFNSSRNEKKK
jgi:hypothetical protein